MAELIVGTGITDPAKLKPLQPIGDPNLIVGTGITDQQAPLTGKATSLDYSRGFTPGLGANEKDFTAASQKGWDEFGNMLGQTVVGAATGAVETTSYLGDVLERIGNRVGEEKEYNNWLAELMQEAKQATKEALPIYLKGENEGFNPNSAEWWRYHGGDTIGTVLGLMVPGLGAAKLAKGLGAGAAGQTIAATLVSRTAESTMEANENFKSTYSQAKEMGMSDEAARMKAGEAAAKVWDTNWVFAAQDFLQFSTLIKGASKAAKGSTLKSIAVLGTNMASEAAEEGGQFVTSKEATSSVFGTDYFGDDFTKRLEDYFHDDEMKTSMLLGAAGGGIFKLGGDITQKLLTRSEGAINDGVEMTHHDMKGDTGSKQKVSNKIEAEQLITAINKGTVDAFINDVKKANTTIEDPAQRRSNEDIVKDAEEMKTLYDKLKTDTSIPEPVKIQTVLRTLERNQAMRLAETLDKEISNSYKQLVDTDELPQETVQLKKLQLEAAAYTELAKKQPQFAAKAAALNQQLAEFSKDPAVLLKAAMLGKPVEQVLATSLDQELKTKTFQYIATKEKQAALNNELKTLSTPAGKQAATEAQKAKATQDKVKQVVTDPTAGKKQLEAALALNQEPELADTIQDKLAQLEAAENADKLASLDAAIAAEGVNIPEPPANPYEGLDPADAAMFGIQIPEAHLPDPDGIDPGLITDKFIEETKPSTIAKADIQKNDVHQELTKEYREKTTTYAWGKRFVGTWQGDEFVYELSPTGEYVDQTYFDKLNPGKKAPFNQTVASTYQGIPLIDTPVVQPGDRVLLVVENGFRFTYSENFDPGTNLDQQVINIYRIDENGNKIDALPLLQLPNADNADLARKPKMQELNKQLRGIVYANNGSVITTIADKNLGSVRRNKFKLSSLAILENDWDLNNNVVRTLPYQPPLGFVGNNGKFEWRNLGHLPHEIQNELKALETTLTTDRLPKSKGGIFTVRRTPKGDLGLEFLQTRKLNDQEKVAVRKLIEEAYNSKDFSALKDILYVPAKATKEEAFNLIENGYRNINTSRLNSQLEFTDVATGVSYPTYYDFLKDTGTLQTELIGSSVIGTSGQDNSYSYVQSTVYLDPNPVVTKTEVDLDKQVVESTTIEFSEPVAAPVATKESTRKRRERSKLKPAVVNKQSFKVISSTELEWMKSHWGEEFYQIAKNLDRFIAENGTEAFGTYYDGLVKMAEFAEEGTGYHEFGHFYLDPINGLVTQKEKDQILEQGGKIFKLKNNSKIEERILQEFEKYKLSNGKYKSPVTEANNFFAKLLQMIKKLLGLKTPLERLFAAIDGTVLTQTQKERILANRGKLENVGDVRFKRAQGFFDYKQQKEAINAITSFLADGIYQASRDEGVSINEILKQEEGGLTKIDGLFKSLLEDFKADYIRISSMPNGPDGLPDWSENDGYRYETYLAMGVHQLSGVPDKDIRKGFTDLVGVWEDKPDPITKFKVEGFKSKVLRDFSRFGLSTRNEDIEPGEDGDSTSTQATQLIEVDELGKIHEQNVTMTNPITGLSQRIKLWLHSIPVPVLDEQGKVVGTEKNLFGKEVKINFLEVDKKLKQKLSDKVDIEASLAQLAEVDPIMSVVYNKLLAEKANDPQLFNEFMVKYKLDTTHGVSILEKKIPHQSQEGLFYTYETRVIDSNRDSTFRMVLTDWKDRAIKKKVVSLTDSTDKNIANKILTDLNKFSERLTLSRATKQPLTYEEVKEKFITTYSQLGVTFPKTFWDNLEFSKTKNPKYVDEKRRRNTNQLASWLTDKNNGSLIDALEATLEGALLFESQALATVAKAAAPFADVDGGAGTYIAEDGTQRNSINLGSYITNWGNMIKTSATYAADLMRDRLYKNNQLLALVNDIGVRDKIRIVEIEATREDNRDAKMFQDRTKTDSIRARFNAFFYNQSKDSKMGVFALPTPSDKSKTVGILLPKKNSTDAKNFLAGILKDTILAEADRIKIVKSQLNLRNEFNSLLALPAPTEKQKARVLELSYLESTVMLADVENMSSKGVQFQYIPELNANVDLVSRLTGSLSKGEVTAVEYSAAVAELTPFINTYIDNYYSKFVDFLVKENIVKETKTGLKNVKIPLGIVGKDASTTTIESFLKQFLYNDTAWQLEMSKVFMGDIALYKSQDDYFKRAYQLVTPGYVGFEKEPTTVVRGVYPKQIKPDARYGEVNKTDAQTYADIHTYRLIADSLGQWSKEHEWLYNNAWKEDKPARQVLKSLKSVLTEKEYKKYKAIVTNTLLVPLKPFQFNEIELTTADNQTKYIKEQIKDSITPIIPDLYYVPNAKIPNPAHKGLAELHAYMKANAIGLMSAADTVKVGSFGILDLSKPAQAWQLRTTKLSSLRYPQLLPSKVKEKTSGSQFHKLIMGNIEDATEYLVNKAKVTGKQLKELYNNAWVEKLEASNKDLQEMLGVDSSYTFSTDPKVREKQMVQLKAFLDEELASRDLDENYVDTLTLVRDSMYGADFSVPLSFPQLGEKFQGILTNIFKREIIKQKSPGFTAVNLADFGLEKSDELKFVDVKDGEVQAAEIGLSINYLSDIGLKPIEHIQPNGRINWDRLNKEQQEALEFIAYRIPTSSKSSMLPVRIAMVLPSNMGNVVMIPGELTKQMGLDFDVDKTQLLRRVLAKDGTIDRQDVNTKLFDIYWSILTNPAHTEEMLTPLATDNLEQIRDEYATLGLFDQVAFPAFSMVSNVNTEVKNKEEKAKVGIGAKATTAHSVLQNIDKDSRPKIFFNIFYKGKNGLELGNTLDFDGRHISANLGEGLQASLDAAKTPLLALFNISKDFTAMAYSMLMAGYPLKVVTDFFMQPIIREFIELYNQEGRNQRKAEEAIFAKYPNIKKLFGDNIRAATLEAEELTENLTKPAEDNDVNAVVLYEFLRASQQAKSMGTLTTVLSIDTYDDLTSIEAIQSLLHSINKITTAEVGIMLPASLLDPATAPIGTKRLATFIEFGLMNALKFANNFYPSVNYTKYHELISEKLALSTITNKDTLKLINQFLNFLQLNQDGTLMNALSTTHPLHSTGKAHYANRWSYVDQNRSIITYMNNVVKEVNNENLTDNKLIKSLRQKTNKDGIILLGVNNTGTDKNKTELINAFDELFSAGDIRVRTLAHDLARYAIETSGMSFSTVSFVNLIPVSFFIENGLGNSWRTKLKMNKFELEPESMFMNLVRNKAMEIKGFPEVYDFFIEPKSKKIVKGVAEEFTLNEDQRTKEKLSQVVIYGDNIYEHSTQRKGVYKLLQQAGEKYYTEVTGTGREKSKLQLPGSPDPFGLGTGVIDAEKTKTYNIDGVDNLAEENELIVKYLPEGSTVKSVLEQLIAEETNLEHLQVLQNLLINSDKITANIEVKSTPGKLGEFAVTETTTGVTAVININPYANTNSAEMVKRTLMHEILHAYTVEVLNNPKTEQEVNFNRNVERLLADAKKSLGEVQGTKNKFEFVAELGSNKQFRADLKKKDLWSRIIRNLRKLVGMKDSYDQLLDQMYSILDQAQSLDPVNTGTYNLDKKDPISKFTDSIQNMLTSLKAERKALLGKGKKVEAIALKTKIAELTKLSETNRIATKLHYFVYVQKQLKQIGAQVTQMIKKPDSISSDNVQILHNQVKSYNSLLEQFYLDIRQLDEAVLKEANVDKEILIGQVDKLRNDIFAADKKIEELYQGRLASFVKQVLPDEDIKELQGNLKIADRDIGKWSQWTRSLVDVADPVLKAVALKLQEIVRAAYREMYTLINRTDEVETKITYRYKTAVFDKDGNNIGVWSPKTFKYNRVGKMKALREYEAWRGSTSTIADKYSPVIDPLSKRADSEGIRFIDPTSKEGQAILNIKKGEANYPLRQFYENFVLDYLGSQESIKLYSQRPGLRIPTVSKSLLEGVIDYKSDLKGMGLFLKEELLSNFRERSDDVEYALVNQSLQPASAVPIRFSSKQDGKKGRFTKEQVSLDIATTTMLFQHNMLEYTGKKEIQADLELAKEALKNRQVIKTKTASYLSGEVVGTEKEGGGYVTMEGAASNSFAAIEDLLERDLYGKRKKAQKPARVLDFLTKISGFNIMFGNVAIPITNAFMGNFGLFVEAVGSNIITATNLKNGYKLYSKNLLAYGKDFGKRAEESEIGKLLAYFNPLDQNRLVDSTGINAQYLRDSWASLMSTGGNAVNHQLAITVMGAVMDRFKVTDSTGKQVPFNEGVEIGSNGKLNLKKGFTYDGKSTITNEQLDKILHYTLRVFHLTSGVYNSVDEGLMNRDFVGRLVSFMRRWLSAGLDARYRRRFKDERLGMQNEGQYISAAIAFNRIFAENGYIAGTVKTIQALMWGSGLNPEVLLLESEKALPQEEQDEIVGLRKANIRKTLMQLYSITILTLMMFAGEDDEDDYLDYLTARARREMMTFVDPTTAWDVLRSPTVMMSNILALQKAVYSTVEAGVDLSLGNEIDIKERGKGKGTPEWLYNTGRLVGANALYQFDDLETSTRLIQDGGFR